MIRRSFSGSLRTATLGILVSIAAMNPAAAQLDALSALLGDLPEEPQALADAIEVDVAEIRGLQFKAPIRVINQSLDDFEKYLDAELEAQLPPERAAVFGRVVTKLGLHRGDELGDIAELTKLLMLSQAAAYYEPADSTFYVLVEDAPAALLATVYAHELYHGLQDQHFDLDAYLLDVTDGSLDDDALLARQAVIEGEATYIMTLWSMMQVTGQVPRGLALDLAVRMQTQMDVQSIKDSLSGGALGDMDDASLAALSDVPSFMIETLIGAYMKGMAFVHSIVRGGWDAAERLYTNPPSSTEQILHPQKWLEGDEPVKIELAGLESSEALADWTLLDSNVIGEVQWRIIFGEHGMQRRAEAAAAGWDGDRYAVFERGDDLLLLLHTVWDSESEADEFAGAYRALLQVKYSDGDEPTRVERRGTEVLIVEGGDEPLMGQYLSVLRSSNLTH